MARLSEDKKRALKEIIRQLHSGAEPQEVKERFNRILASTSPSDIASIEQELVREGMPREEIRRLCDVHMMVFRDQLEKQELNVPAGHPISILMEEHRIMLQLAEKLGEVAEKIELTDNMDYVVDEVHELEHVVEDFLDSEKHYLREENVLFPNLERHGITEPPAIMWTEHNEIREKKKRLREVAEKLAQNRGEAVQSLKRQLSEVAESLNSLLSNHFFKENNILFPAALQVITGEEWTKIRQEFDEIGYCCFTPPQILTAAPKTEEKAETEMKTEAGQKSIASEQLQFDTGSLSREELEGVLNTLPVDITFVDKDDSVKYFSKGEKRIFVRTKAIIGRSVQQCHPQKSVHIVNRIVESFKSGKRDSAEFWINLNNRLIHIRYFAVRDKDGKYLGTMEVTQDVTDIKRLEGEKRLLDWEG